MIPQSKGKDLGKVPVSKLDDLYYSSIKYDGHYVQIHKKNNQIKFFTSGGKEFYIDHIAEELINNNPNIDFIIENEYIADTDGKLGSRGKAAKLTTYRTDFIKGINSITTPGKDIFKAFDIISLDIPSINIKITPETCNFRNRLCCFKYLNLGTHIEKVRFVGPINLVDCKNLASVEVKIGFEGLFLKSTNHIYYPGKRVNNAIKLKIRPTADLLCISITRGEGKYDSMIGSLGLQDSEGRLVFVGSGLSDYDRGREAMYFIGSVIEISYEQILDTYIQPIYVGIRLDKEESD